MIVQARCHSLREEVQEHVALRAKAVETRSECEAQTAELEAAEALHCF